MAKKTYLVIINSITLLNYNFDHLENILLSSNFLNMDTSSFICSLMSSAIKVTSSEREKYKVSLY